MKNRTENISVRYRPQHLTKSQNILNIVELWLAEILLATADVTKHRRHRLD